jgi:hypothetical protein
MGLHRAKRTYGISETKLTYGTRHDQQDKGIRQDEEYRPENAVPRGQIIPILNRTNTTDGITQDYKDRRNYCICTGSRVEMGLKRIMWPGRIKHA